MEQLWLIFTMVLVVAGGWYFGALTYLTVGEDDIAVARCETAIMGVLNRKDPVALFKLDLEGGFVYRRIGTDVKVIINTRSDDPSWGNRQLGCTFGLHNSRTHSDLDGF